MTETLPVAINRGDIHAIDVPPSFEVADTFVVRVENHGSPTHVHLHLDDALSRVASLGAPNRYVAADDAEEVVVRVADGPRPAEGTLEVVTGYGAESARVAIDVVEPDQAEDAVAVDESMASPPADDADEDRATASVAGVSRDVLPVLALSAVAVLFAVVAAVISDALAVVLGVLAVLAGVGAAVVMLREE